MDTVEGYRLLAEAASDVIYIWEALDGDIPAAMRFQEELENSMRKLAASPLQGEKRLELAPRNFRFWGVGDYMIVYVPDEIPVLIVGVLPAHGSPAMLAALLRNR